jgi:hypothetical protein
MADMKIVIELIKSMRKDFAVVKDELKALTLKVAGISTQVVNGLSESDFFEDLTTAIEEAQVMEAKPRTAINTTSTVLMRGLIHPEVKSGYSIPVSRSNKFSRSMNAILHEFMGSYMDSTSTSIRSSEASSLLNAVANECFEIIKEFEIKDSTGVLIDFFFIKQHLNHALVNIRSNRNRKNVAEEPNHPMKRKASALLKSPLKSPATSPATSPAKSPAKPLGAKLPGAMSSSIITRKSPVKASCDQVTSSASDDELEAEFEAESAARKKKKAKNKKRL